MPRPNKNFVVDGENSDSVTHMYGEGNTVNVMKASEGIMEASEGNNTEEKEAASESDSWVLLAMSP